MFEVVYDYCVPVPSALVSHLLENNDCGQTYTGHLR